MRIAALVLASISFGPLGPPQRVTYHDAKSNLEIVYRLAQNPRAAVGPAAQPPSTAAGTLSTEWAGRRRTYDLTRLLPVYESYVSLPSGGIGCGVTEPLARHGRYAIVASVQGGKGCYSTATFIDMNSGRVAERVDIDRRWARRYDVEEVTFDSSAVTVERVEAVPIAATTPRTFILVTGRDTHGPRLFSFEANANVPQAISMPSVGSTVRVGTFSGAYKYLVYDGPAGKQVRFDPSDDHRYEALQTPAPADLGYRAQRNQWFEISEQLVRDGRLADAVDAFARVVALDNDSDSEAEILKGDKAFLEHCAALVAQVRAGHVSAATARAEWPYGCAPKPAGY
jgi:hypothetical protein